MHKVYAVYVKSGANLHIIQGIPATSTRELRASELHENSIEVYIK